MKVVDNFKYLGARTKSSETDFQIRKAAAWNACHKLKKIWTSKLSKKMKKRLFLATVVSVFLYGSETWTVTEQMRKRIDGCYTRMLRMAFNVHWQSHTTNSELYGDLLPLSTMIQQRRMRLSGHIVRHPEEMAHQLVLWTPTEGQRNRGRQRKTYIDNLLDDTGADNVIELKSMMEDRETWRERVKSTGCPDGRHR